MNGVKRLKFSSAHMARDIPNIKFTYSGSVKRPKSKKATMPLPSRCQKVSFSFFPSDFSSCSLQGESVPSCRFPLLLRSLEQKTINKTNQNVGTSVERVFFLFEISNLFSHYIYRRGKWPAARPGRNLPPGKSRYPLYRRLGGRQDRSGWAENLVPTGIRSRTVQPAVSCYTD